VFGFRRRTDESLEFLRLVTWDVLRESRRQAKQLRMIMSNQEVFDGYAAQIAEQNRQIRAAANIILAEVGRLQAAAVAAAEKPLDTSKMEEALGALTAAVDQVEAIPAPVAEETVVEESVVVVEEPVEEPVEEVEVVEEATTAADEDDYTEE
jgi:hypothetical protein